MSYQHLPGLKFIFVQARYGIPTDELSGVSFVELSYVLLAVLSVGQGKRECHAESFLCLATKWHAAAVDLEREVREERMQVLTGQPVLLVDLGGDGVGEEGRGEGEAGEDLGEDYLLVNEFAS